MHHPTTVDSLPRLSTSLSTAPPPSAPAQPVAPQGSSRAHTRPLRTAWRGSSYSAAAAAAEAADVAAAGAAAAVAGGVVATAVAVGAAPEPAAAGSVAARSPSDKAGSATLSLAVQAVRWELVVAAAAGAARDCTSAARRTGVVATCDCKCAEWEPARYRCSSSLHPRRRKRWREVLGRGSRRTGVDIGSMLGVGAGVMEVAGRWYSAVVAEAPRQCCRRRG